MDKIKIGNYLMELRKSKGLSQANLAELIGVTFQAVSKWERGDAVPDIAILEQLAGLYGVAIDENIKGKSSEKPIVRKEVSFLKQNRRYGFWISLIFLIVFFLTGFLPFVREDLDNILSVQYNYYKVIFYLTPVLEYYLFLIQFFVILFTPLITMCFCACTKKETFKKLYLVRFIFVILMLVSLLINIWYMTKNLMTIGNIFQMILLIIYSVSCLSFKCLRKSFLEQDFQDKDSI